MWSSVFIGQSFVDPDLPDDHFSVSDDLKILK